MVWAVCEDLGVNYADAVVLYQSEFFTGLFPDENQKFGNVEYVPKVNGDREASLLLMRETMLSRNDLTAAVFIGGMEGVLAEYELFTQFNSNATVLAIPSPGGAAQELAANLGAANAVDAQDVDFAKIIYTHLGIEPDEERVV